MKKTLLFLRVHWLKILGISIFGGIFIFGIYGAIIGFQAFGALEPFTKRMMLGQMALMGVMFFMVH
ncbi:hypothetical protein MNBD_BACTEROID05-1223, partial [hydrothermal vent metagenome]